MVFENRPGLNSPAAQSGTTVGMGTPPPPLPEADVEEIDARLRAQGMLPFVSDLEACQSVVTARLALFCQMSGGLASEMAKQMQGTIASLSTENSYFSGRLARVQVQLDSLRDVRFFNLYEENRSLKEEVEKLEGLQEKLTASNAKVVVQTKLLDKLPTIEGERDSARKSLKDMETEVDPLRTRVAELIRKHEEADIRFCKASASGF